jgi:hypothetical protein
MIRRFLDRLLALIVRGSRQEYESRSGLLSAAEMRRRIGLHQLAAPDRDPAPILLHFVVDVRTRQSRRQFGDLLHACQAVATSAGAVGYLDPLRLAILAPHSESISVRRFARQLSDRRGVDAVVESVITFQLQSFDPEVEVTRSLRRWCCDGTTSATAVAAAPAMTGPTRRVIEVALAGVGLVLLAPLLLLLAVTVKITSPGPIFLVDRRLDRWGRPRRVYRFRARVAEPAAPALTSVGGFLQETRLEQLPQLWNVLRGDFCR